MTTRARSTSHLLRRTLHSPYLPWTTTVQNLRRHPILTLHADIRIPILQTRPHLILETLWIVAARLSGMYMPTATRATGYPPLTRLLSKTRHNRRVSSVSLLAVYPRSILQRPCQQSQSRRAMPSSNRGPAQRMSLRSGNQSRQSMLKVGLSAVYLELSMWCEISWARLWAQTATMSRLLMGNNVSTP